jgi:hypothetical protein
MMPKVSLGQPNAGGCSMRSVLESLSTTSEELVATTHGISARACEWPENGGMFMPVSPSS